MLLLEALQIKHYVKDRLLLDIDQLYIHKNDRIGLVGRNGSGKTTLLSILAGGLPRESGTIIHHAQCELLPQLKTTDAARSGGEITQSYIQQALMKAPDIFLADEPTTHLDTEHIEWLEKKLLQWKGSFVIVSHDRTFLNTVCTKIWELNDGEIKEYKGSYREYEVQKEAELRQKKLAYEKYECKKKQLEEALRLKEKKAEKATKAPKGLSSSEASITGARPYFAKKQKKLQKTAKAIEKRIDHLEKPEKVKEYPALKMSLPNEEVLQDRIVLRLQQVSGTIGQRLLWDSPDFHIRAGDKLAVIGPNGSGKTSLLKKIVHQDSGVTISPAVKIGYFSQHLTILDVKKSILENVRSTSKQEEALIRTVLARLHFYKDDVYKPAGVLSGGERVKAALAKLFLSDINMFILDEPTSFLDIDATYALEALLKEYSGTVIFASHDRRLIDNVATKMAVIRNQKIELFEGTYEQYKQRKQLKKNPDKNADKLLVLDMKISEVLSRLSIEPSEQLEKEFQLLLQEKQALNRFDH